MRAAVKRAMYQFPYAMVALIPVTAQIPAAVVNPLMKCPSLLMTLKVIANHAISPEIKLKPNVGSNQACTWIACDFSDGEEVETTFSIHFDNARIANEFKTKFEACQADMAELLVGQDQADEDGTVEEAAEALGGLAVEGNDTSEADE